MKDKQMKLFEVKTRVQNMIDNIDTDQNDNVVRVKIPKIADLCRDYAPQHFKVITVD